MKIGSDSRAQGRIALLLLLFAAFILIAGCSNQKPSPIVFAVPDHLPNGTVGVQYGYSFCKPDLQSASGTCGGAQTTNPTGGQSPYSFTLGASTAPAPFGLSLDMNGLLEGAPNAAGNRTFQVCAKDVGGYEKCQKTNLTINPAPFPGGCTSDFDCETGYYCEQGICKINVQPECTDDSQCNTGLCRQGVCVGCTADSDCATGYCEQGICKPSPQPQCANDSQCDSNLCEDGNCAQCESDGDCHGSDICEESKCVAQTASVTIDSGSCATTEVYSGVGVGTLHDMGAHYARYYGIQASGSMSGSVGTVFSITYSPEVPGQEEQFSCGDWEKDSLMTTCTRQNASMPETAQWSDSLTNVMGEYVNVDPNLQVTVHVKVSVPYYRPRDEKTSSISCPKVDY